MTISFHSHIIEPIGLSFVGLINLLLIVCDWLNDSQLLLIVNGWHSLSSHLHNHQGLQSAPIYDSDTHRFTGMLTVTDYIRLILYYYSFPLTIETEFSQLTINGLKKLKHSDIVSLQATDSIYEAAKVLIQNKLHRLPIFCEGVLVSVITQFKILRFLTVSFEEIFRIKECPIILGINIYTYTYK